MINEVDWEKVGPSAKILEVFDWMESNLEDDSFFEDTYSQQAWCVAYRIYKVAKYNPDVLFLNDPMDNIEGVKFDELSISGYQWGWAVNCVRALLGFEAGPNPSVIEVIDNEKFFPVHPARNFAALDMEDIVRNCDSVLGIESSKANKELDLIKKVQNKNPWAF